MFEHRNPEPGRDAAASLGFLAPGMVHMLGNALFRIQGHAQLLRTADPDVQRQRREILGAVERAGQAVALLRCFLGDAGSQRVQPGVLLPHLSDCLRVCLRERGLLLVSAHTSRQTPSTVDGPVFCRAILAAVRALSATAPEGCGGVVQVDLFAQEDTRILVRIDLRPDPALLPFPVEADACAAVALRELGICGVHITALAGASALMVEVPCSAPERVATAPSRYLHGTA